VPIGRLRLRAMASMLPWPYHSDIGEATQSMVGWPYPPNVVDSFGLGVWDLGIPRQVIAVVLLMTSLGRHGSR
jgi:hypothetical protein